MPIQRIIQCCCYTFAEDKSSCPDFEEVSNRLETLHYSSPRRTCAVRKGFMCLKKNPQELFGYALEWNEVRPTIEKRIKK